MKNSDFIRDAVAGKLAAPRRGKDYRECSNVIFDGTHLYSYGFHYPLVVRMETPGGMIHILNDRGYSSSTGKHISAARSYVDGAVHLPRIGGFATSPTSPEAVWKAADEETAELYEQIRQELRKIEDRPRYAHVYQRAIDAAERRINALKNVQRYANAAINLKREI